MKTIIIQEDTKLRLLLYPETPADEYTLKIMQGCFGQAKLIAMDGNEVQRVVNPYKEANGTGKGTPAIMVEMEINKLPQLTFEANTSLDKQ